MSRAEVRVDGIDPLAGQFRETLFERLRHRAVAHRTRRARPVRRLERLERLVGAAHRRPAVAETRHESAAGQPGADMLAQGGSGVVEAADSREPGQRPGSGNPRLEGGEGERRAGREGRQPAQRDIQGEHVGMCGPVDHRPGGEFGDQSDHLPGLLGHQRRRDEDDLPMKRGGLDRGPELATVGGLRRDGGVRPVDERRHAPSAHSDYQHESPSDMLPPRHNKGASPTRGRASMPQVVPRCPAFGQIIGEPLDRRRTWGGGGWPHAAGATRSAVSGAGARSAHRRPPAQPPAIGRSRAPTTTAAGAPAARADAPLARPGSRIHGRTA